MERAVWSEKYRLGVEAIDKQHRQLFDLIANLNRLIAAQAGVVEVRAALAQFVRWAEIHFASEQTLLEVTGYPDLAAHIVEHEAFLKALARNVELVASRPLAVTETKIAGLLTSWLQKHILENDRAYLPHVLANIPPQAAAEASSETES